MTDQTLREAAQKALEALRDYHKMDDDRLSVAMAILQDALAASQAEPAPSAGIEADRYGQTEAVLYDHSLPVGTALYAHPPAPQAEPNIERDWQYWNGDKWVGPLAPTYQASVQEIMAMADEYSNGWRPQSRAALESAVAAQAGEIERHRADRDTSLAIAKRAEVELEALRLELQRETADHAQSTDDALELLREVERLRAELELRRKSGSAVERLHNLCEGISAEADGSEFSREEWNRIDAENLSLQNEVKRLRAFIEGDCICPCCTQVRACSDDCTFDSDDPNSAARMAEARSVLLPSTPR